MNTEEYKSTNDSNINNEPEREVYKAKRISKFEKIKNSLFGGLENLKKDKKFWNTLVYILLVVIIALVIVALLPLIILGLLVWIMYEAIAKVSSHVHKEYQDVKSYQEDPINFEKNKNNQSDTNNQNI
ncbi:hypothetical protein [Malacoplasma penetrans HF-2]|uniref:Uncharacterized protein n=1 Tax=Malacoplasma penetrans (strain HF-2) TaxID=272633 RepID=Q8EUQ3_MALP2|nr:hypothetical protein [Malacoplasma penetrans]BAC44659.1 hypothetical protein [Malacoplasma penetrans HF-2]